MVESRKPHLPPEPERREGEAGWILKQPSWLTRTPLISLFHGGQTMKVVAEERKTQKVKAFDPSTVVGLSHGLLDWGLLRF